MFGNREKETPMESYSKPSLVNLIGEGTTIRGAIDADCDLRIAGNVIGNIRCKGKVIVAKGGKIEGDMHAEEADIAGNVSGQLHLSKKLSLRIGCEVEGDIFTKSLNIEDGAVFEGRCVMREATAKVNPIAAKNTESKAGNAG
jgi:cytoskeletal protein CcmA (bactofilin family)